MVPLVAVVAACLLQGPSTFPIQQSLAIELAVAAVERIPQDLEAMARVSTLQEQQRLLHLNSQGIKRATAAVRNREALLVLAWAVASTLGAPCPSTAARSLAMRLSKVEASSAPVSAI